MLKPQITQMGADDLSDRTDQSDPSDLPRICDKLANCRSFRGALPL
ncbi:MAG: hypothetical protein ACOYCD_04195 [Kiritimatiellia bacterium]